MDYDAKDLQSVLLYMRGRFGAGAFEEPRRMVAILMDLSPDLKRDGNVLRQMSEAGLLREQRIASESGAEHEQLRTVTKSYDWLTDYLQLPDERADYYVAVLKTAYGLTVETPKPQSAAPPQPFAPPTPQAVAPPKSTETAQSVAPTPHAVKPSNRTGDCVWTLDGGGVLTISGQGAMGNYDSVYAQPWSGKRSAIMGVIIKEGVTCVGDMAFASCESLKSVRIPHSVTKIGAFAFRDCKSLTSVQIPQGVTEIESSAFAFCAGLQSVKLPDSVTSIGGWAFQNCRSLTSVRIPNGVKQIGYWAFYACDSLKSVSVPSHTAIGEDAFGLDTVVMRR